MKAQLQHSFKITPTTPFAFDYTFYKPDHFTTNDNVWEPGVRWQTWRHGKKALGIKFENKGTINNPTVQVKLYAKKALRKDELSSLKKEIIYRYNLDYDLKPFYSIANKFKSLPLKQTVKKLNGMRPGHPSSLYEYLIIGVVLQNATVKRSIQMFTNLLREYGELLEFDGKKLYCFWAPGKLKDVREEELRELKVGYRAKFIKRLDDAFVNNNINEKQLRKRSLQEQKEFLLSLYGIGPATVWYILFDVFHHVNHFDHVSPWEQKIYSKIFFDTAIDNPKPTAKILELINSFKPYQHLVIHYIWENLWWQYKNGKAKWLGELIKA